MATSINLNDLISQATVGNMAAQETILSNTSQTEQLLRGMQERAKETAASQVLVTETAGLAEVKAQEQSLAAATRLGTNPEAATYVLSDYIDQKNAAFQEARALQQQINRKRSVTLANPLEWLEAQLTVANDVNAYNAVAQDYNMVGRQIDDLVAMTGNIDQMTAQIAQTKTTESVKAAAQVAASQALNLADNAAMDALKTNSEGIFKVQQLQEGQLNTAFRVRDQQMQEAQFALAQRNANMQASRLALELKKEKRQEEDDAISLNSWNAFRVSAGLPVGTKQMMDMAYRADPDGTMVEINNGLRTLNTKQMNPSADARFIGSTPAEALSIAGKYNLALDPGRNKLLGMVSETQARLMNDPAQAAKMKTRASAVQTINAAVETEVKTQHAAITSSDNIYAPPSLATLMSDPAIARTASAQIVLKPLLDSGVKAFEPKTIVPQILEQVKKGKLPLNQALADIDFLANKSIMYNNNMYSYKGTLGIPDQTSLNIQLDTTGVLGGFINQVNARTTSSVLGTPLQFFGGQKLSIVNLADRAQVQDYANKYLAAQIVPALRQRAQVQNQK